MKLNECQVEYYPRHITIKFVKTRNKEKNLKDSKVRGKRQYYVKL